MKYRRKSVTVDAKVWSRNGDVSSVDPIESANSGVDLAALCPMCGMRMSMHGWLKSPSGDSSVCPGSVVVTREAGGVEHRFTVAKEVFDAMYEPDAETVLLGVDMAAIHQAPAGVPVQLAPVQDPRSLGPRAWRCECGERCNPLVPEWRATERGWEHKHDGGYVLANVDGFKVIPPS